MANWKKKNWRNSKNEPVKNIGMWQELDNLLSTYKDIEMIWVKGHSTNKWNNACDSMAVQAIRAGKGTVMTYDNI